jgi:hypothetical protein
MKELLISRVVVGGELREAESKRNWTVKDDQKVNGSI